LQESILRSPNDVPNLQLRKQRVGVVGLDAAHLARGLVHLVHLFGGENGVDDAHDCAVDLGAAAIRRTLSCATLAAHAMEQVSNAPLRRCARRSLSDRVRRSGSRRGSADRLAWSISRQNTWLPRSARQAPVTRPTYPVPITVKFIVSQAATAVRWFCRKSAYAAPKPFFSSTSGCQPSCVSFELSISLRGLPSGLLRS
jgi:hypothetical protein